jgi:uncharacterized RDD family membrane protein YckC
MRSIEVLTTQNVPIVYEVASLRDRMLAFLLDSIFIWGSIAIVSALLSATGWLNNGTFYLFFVFLFVVPVIFFYTLSMEVFNNGQSFGKKIIRLKVIKLSGQETSLTDYMLRAVFRVLDIYFSVGAIAAMMVSSSESGQRLGDMVANTTVVRLEAKFSMSLANLLKIGSFDNYEPQYLAVRKFNDQQMLLVKTVLDRSQKFNNQAHATALDLMARSLAKQLGLNELPANKIQFLKTVLKDYVILTR